MRQTAGGWCYRPVMRNHSIIALGLRLCVAIAIASADALGFLEKFNLLP